MPSELATRTQGKQVTLADLMDMDIASKGFEYAARVFGQTVGHLVPPKHHALMEKLTSALLTSAGRQRDAELTAWVKSQLAGSYQAVYAERKATERERAIVEKLASTLEESSPGKVIDKVAQLIPDIKIDMPPINVNGGSAQAEKQWTVEADDGIAVDIDEEAGVIRVRHE